MTDRENPKVPETGSEPTGKTDLSFDPQMPHRVLEAEIVEFLRRQGTPRLLALDIELEPREVLAAHGWTQVAGTGLAWRHDEGEATAYRHGNTFDFVGGYPLGAAELRAFAAIAEESKP